MKDTAATEIYDSLTAPLLSLPQVALLLLILLATAIGAGHWAGLKLRQRRARRGELADLSGGETTLGAVLALLGLILAFSFGNSLATYQARKAAILEESNALGTAFVRADYLLRPSSQELQRALYGYALTRIPSGPGLGNRAESIAFLERTLEAQARLWPMTIEATRGEIPAPIQAFVAGAVNAVLDSHLKRVQSMSTPVSEINQIMTLMVALIALCWISFRDGLAGSHVMPRTIVFPTMLWVVMMAIVDTQRADDGFIRDDYGVLRTVIREMEIALQV